MVKACHSVQFFKPSRDCSTALRAGSQETPNKDNIPSHDPFASRHHPLQAVPEEEPRRQQRSGHETNAEEYQLSTLDYLHPFVAHQFFTAAYTGRMKSPGVKKLKSALGVMLASGP